MSKHLILGDVHLGKGLSIGKPGTKANSRLTDQQTLLDWVLQTAITEKVNSIIITGDIYEEPRPHPALIQFFMTWLKKCERVNIDVHVIAGNHDIIRTGVYTVSALDIIPAVELTHAKTYKNIGVVNYPGVSFTLVPYRDRRMYDAPTPDEALKLLKGELSASMTAENLFKKDPGLNILIGHLTLDGSMYVGDEIDDMLNEIFCPLEMFFDYDYVWMGHIHNPQVLNKKPHIAHIGSMDKSDFGKNELNDKIIVIIDTDSNDTFKEIVIPTRPLRKIEISVSPDKDTTDFIINYLHAYNNENSLKDCILKLEIILQGQETPNSDKDKIIKYLYNSLNIHYIPNYSESRTIVVNQHVETQIFDNNMSIPSAIGGYTDFIVYESDEEKNAVKDIMLNCYEELKQKRAS